MFRDRSYFTNLGNLALPIILQNLITSSLNFVDVMMVGQLGETTLAAAGIAGQINFLMMIFMFGITSGSSVFMAQFWGKKDVANIKRVLGLSLGLSIAISLIFSVVCLVFPGAIIAIFSTDPSVIAQGTLYLRTTSVTFVLMAISFSYGAAMRSTGNVRLPVIISTIVLLLKTLFGYIFIFGKLGLAPMGIQGAADATVIARVFECAALLFFIYRSKYPAAAKPAEMIGLKKEFLKDYIKTAMPVLLNEMLWALGTTTYNLVYARIGTESIAAANIAFTIENMVFALFIGISDATAIMVGNKIGAGQEDKAYEYGLNSVVLTIVGAMVIGFSLSLNSGWIVLLYKISPAASLYAANMIRIMGFIVWVKVTNMVLWLGMFRSGGDTRFAMILDAGSVWFIGVPLALISAFTFHLPVYMVYLIVFSEEAFKFLIALWRFFSKRWINNLVKNI